MLHCDRLAIASMRVLERERKVQKYLNCTPGLPPLGSSKWFLQEQMA